ncbi:MAG: GNAT family N-acetyltransferase, partial [Myxococcales bacterium]|nr:GNAT family N-acetyltransferase [Myxococcales bacterium]
SHQTVDDTRTRCARGETWVIEHDGRLVATGTLEGPGTSGCAWYARPDVAKVQQLAVDPTFQGAGMGRTLHDRIAARARALGATELALDTSEHAGGLHALYGRWGYRRVDTIDHRPTVNYASVVLSKTLETPEETLARRAPGGAHRLRDDSTIEQGPGRYVVRTPSDPTGWLNEVVEHDALTDAEVSATVRSFAGRPLKWCVWPWSDPDLAQRLTAHGMTSWTASAMVREPGGACPDGVVRVDADVVDAFTAVWAEGWGQQDGTALRDVQRYLEQPDVRLFLAHVDGEPAGVAGTRDLDGGAYLFGAVVLPRHRGRGAYRDLLTARLADLASRGVPLAVTHARDATSTPILDRAGFRRVFGYRVFFGG